MSEKRPETEADIISRSKLLVGEQALVREGVSFVPMGRRNKPYSVDLPRHMAQCDANYHRLIRLFPDMRKEAELAFALLLSSCDANVVFKVLEKGPYTTLIKIQVSVDDKWLALAAAPLMTVRIYHDAQSAEVVSYQNQNRFYSKYDYPNTGMRQRDEKVQINRFLGEFLTLCQEHGGSSDPLEIGGWK
ncbi:MAG: DUF1249 domain-containing protein [Gammaproteobacteria bacterium]|nr:DUF1249 domain-containing protein [Gammaproteobacteria bacterium]